MRAWTFVVLGLWQGGLGDWWGRRRSRAGGGGPEKEAFLLREVGGAETLTTPILAPWASGSCYSDAQQVREASGPRSWWFLSTLYSWKREEKESTNQANKGSDHSHLKNKSQKTQGFLLSSHHMIDCSWLSAEES